MGRQREFSITYVKNWMIGFFSINKQDCIAEVYGKVTESGGTYIGKDLIGKRTVTYVIKDGIAFNNNAQGDCDGE